MEQHTSHPGAGPVSLLIVDDSPYVLRSVRMLLRTVPGLDIRTATDGEQAVERVEQSAPDLVLMDVQMPRMNGFEATRRVKDHAPDTTVLMMSVLDRDSVRNASRASGAEHFLTKGELHRSLLPRIKALFPFLQVFT